MQMNALPMSIPLARPVLFCLVCSVVLQERFGYTHILCLVVEVVLMSRVVTKVSLEASVGGQVWLCKES